jgi:cytoskeletal protein RodZ
MDRPPVRSESIDSTIEPVPERKRVAEGGEPDARSSLALWLRAGRARRGMSLDDVARVTKIQPRILERLETGQLDGLPAEVFVRGFVRSFARCVGLNEVEALRRYAACGIAAAGSSDLTPTARALVEAMAELVPNTSTAVRATPRKMTAVEIIELRSELRSDEAAAPPSDAPGQVSSATPSGDAPSSAPVPATCDDGLPAAGVAPAVAVGPAAAEPATEPAAVETAAVATEPAAVETAAVVPAAAISAEASGGGAVAGGAGQGGVDRGSSKKKRGRRAKRNKRARDRMAVGTPPAASPVVTGGSGTWSPTMPPMSSVPSVPWRRPLAPATASRSGSVVVPSLVIDDADPESAERVLEERAENHAPRRSFLPPILLDREDRSARQGGLTLAVIILLIAATLTLSYLMRRPSASGDGVTRFDPPATAIVSASG